MPRTITRATSCKGTFVTILKGNKKNATISLTTKSVVDKYFFTLTMKLKYQYSWNECGEFNVSIVCDLGNNLETLQTFMISRNCSDVCDQYAPCFNNGTCVPIPNTNKILCSCCKGFQDDKCETLNLDFTTTEASNEANSGASSTTGIVVVTIIVSLCVVALVAALCLNRKKILPTKCLNGKESKVVSEENKDNQTNSILKSENNVTLPLVERT